MKLAFLILILMTTATFAHHGSNQQVKILSGRISESPSSSLLTLRASLYVKEGKFESAKLDLRKALQLDPHFQAAKDLLKKL